MASSPPAVSPSIPTLALPKKRPSLGPPGPPSNAKRRKPSTGPSSLRQTSFPPEGPPSATDTPHYSRSPSVDSVLTTSVVNGAGGGKKRKRKKGDDDTASLAGASTKGGKGGAESAHADDAGDEGDDDEGEEAVDTVLEGGKMDEAAEKQFREHLSMLVEALDDDQAERYDIWRRVKLKKEIVRRITNQTLSQSVPASVVTTINGYTKLFIGNLIDRARQVQSEWIAASPKLPTGEPNPAYEMIYPPSPPDSTQGTQSRTNSTIANEDSQASGSGASATIPNSSLPTVNGSSSTANDSSQTSSPPRILRDRILERDRGPLTPDHLREAYRRYKRDREGGGAGVAGLSLMGREQTAARMGGRKLFR